MNWFINMFSSSIGKKLMMAFTGLCFCGFLVVHLIGNLTVYVGPDFFNSYVAHLHAYDPLIRVAELGLLALACMHVLTGLTLFWQNLQARPNRYAVNKSGGGRTIGSATMPYTGILLLVLIVIHLINFHFADKTDRTVYDIMLAAFQQPAYVLIYIVFVIVSAIHISHGLWSACQTFGINHVKYTPFIKGLGVVFAIVIGAGFGFIPIFISLIA